MGWIILSSWLALSILFGHHPILAMIGAMVLAWATYLHLTQGDNND